MINVIVVDDDPTNAGLIKMLLELDGFKVDSCTDFDEAKAASTNATKAYVIDCNLARGASGIDILRAIRKDELASAPSTAVIMTSGDYRLEEETLDAGANQFLLKPYSPDVLSKAITELLQPGGEIAK
jgi:DNA-binding response OmpR family regulator